jgi:hypothetical protein
VSLSRFRPTQGPPGSYASTFCLEGRTVDGFMMLVSPESKLFHAIVVVGLSFASSGCGSTAASSETDVGDASDRGPTAGGEALAEAGRIVPSPADASAPDGREDAGGTLTLGPPPDAAPPIGSDSATVLCEPDAQADAHCVWPHFI